jgi:hypothetical protein
MLKCPVCGREGDYDVWFQVGFFVRGDKPVEAEIDADYGIYCSSGTCGSEFRHAVISPEKLAEITKAWHQLLKPEQET